VSESYALHRSNYQITDFQTARKTIFPRYLLSLGQVRIPREEIRCGLLVPIIAERSDDIFANAQSALTWYNEFNLVVASRFRNFLGILTRERAREMIGRQASVIIALFAGIKSLGGRGVCISPEDTRGAERYIGDANKILFPFPRWFINLTKRARCDARKSGGSLPIFREIAPVEGKSYPANRLMSRLTLGAL